MPSTAVDVGQGTVVAVLEEPWDARYGGVGRTGLHPPGQSWIYG
jgi:hypothetical protein